MTQQEYLRAVKAQLDLEWDELAALAGIHPRALKTYRMPESSQNFRVMPNLAKAALERLVQDRKKQVRGA